MGLVVSSFAYRRWMLAVLKGVKMASPSKMSCTTLTHSQVS